MATKEQTALKNMISNIVQESLEESIKGLQLNSSAPAPASKESSKKDYNNPIVEKGSEVELGTGIKVKFDGRYITTVVDVSKTYGKSKSGKSEVVATTSGRQWLTYRLSNGEKRDICHNLNYNS